MHYPNSWLCFKRHGNDFFAYRSDDGYHLTLLLSSSGFQGSEFGFKSAGYLGLCVSSHNNTPPFDLCQVKFRNYVRGHSVDRTFIVPTSLQFTRDGNNAFIKWPTANGLYVLQSGLLDGNWSDITTGITEQDTNNVYTVVNPKDNKFFRLIGR
jgi:hypothetical protein